MHYFITLADSEFRVSQNEDFREKGSAFNPSLRIGIMMSHLRTHSVLIQISRNIHGPYSLDHSLDLCLQISKMAELVKNSGPGLHGRGLEVAARHKPLALAIKANGSCDTSLFGENPQKGGTFETIARMTLDHFQQEEGDFVLPEIQLVCNKSSNSTSLVVDGSVVCPDFDRYERAEIERMKPNAFAEMLDPSLIEEKHGASPQGIPSLETLCIPELHKSGYENAKGESDGAVIQYKAMMAASQK